MTDDPPMAEPRHGEDPDERLLGAARHGDERAFATLLRRHDDQMRALAWSVLRDRAAMDDVLQDAYLKAFRHLDRFRGDSRFSTWLHRIVYRSSLDHLRRRHPTGALDEADAPPVPRSGEADVDTRMTVERALASLDPETAAALVLVDRDGHTYGEAGEILGIPAGTVASRLHRGRRSMRAALAPTPADRPEGEAR